MKKELRLDSIRNFINTKLDPNSILERKSFDTQIALQADEERTFIAKITTSAVDRDGDLLSPMGCDYSEYESNPIVLWNHSRSLPQVGKVVALQKQPDAVYLKVNMAPTEQGLELWELIKGSYLRAMSIGFIAKNALIRGTKEFARYVRDNSLQITEDCKRIITDYYIMESSLVPIPANQEALIQAYSTKGIHLNVKLAKEFGIKEIEIKGETGEQTAEQVKQEGVILPEQPITPVVAIAEPIPTEPSKEAVAPIITEPIKTEPLTTNTVEPIKIEQVVEIPKEVIVPVEIPKTPAYRVIRVGSYQVTDQDKAIAKAYKTGKIV